MSFSVPSQDDGSGEGGTPHLSIGGHAPPLSASFKASSLNGSSGTTPRLLFTWDPYSNLSPMTASPSAPTAAGGGPLPPKPSEVEGIDEGRQPSSGEECSTPSSAANNNGNYTCHHNSDAGATAHPPLTISALLSASSNNNAAAVGGATARSPQLVPGAAVHTPHQQPSTDTASAHSTPSGPVRKRISTTTKDGRQYFLDYSPTTAASANPTGGVGVMPNLMLPPNLSPQSRGVSPFTAAPSQPRAPTPSYQSSNLPSQQQQQIEQQEFDNYGSSTTSPQAVPLVSPPRSSSIGGVAGPGSYPYNASFNHPVASNGVYDAVPPPQQQKPPSSAFLGSSMNSGGLLSVSVVGTGSGSGSHSQHNPYRTSPTYYQPQMSTSVSSAAAATAAATSAGSLPQHGMATAAVQRVQTADTDADLYEVLGATPSLFIKRLLPPPPPLPDVARVLPTPGVVQTLCARWCSLVEAVLRSREFSDVTTAPPPPPAMPSLPGASPTETTGSEEESRRRNTNTTTTTNAVQEELRAWYKAAVEWYEQLDQAGAATVDIRASSRAVTWAIDAAASGRGRRGGQASSNNNNSRYHGQNAGGRGGVGAGAGAGGSSSGYRGGAYGGGYPGSTPYGGRGAMNNGGYRGGRGATPSFYTTGGMNSNNNNNSNNNSSRSASNDMEVTANSSGNARNPYYASNFNPYAESWTFSGDTQMVNVPGEVLPPPPPPPPLPSTSSKPSYLSKMSTADQQGYSANPAMGPM
ncbi:hypothetical protein ABB37_08823 [Leptomonas pyrrhocoris]|uniref:Uncharacterized protein n=1 Tax=Leptomonas pyrrhocoris TaxID=157538 RepID=A0A0N0DRZ2_LEPPY|nr:hypothetical protein ABB37_08823 [Leptomonas pyrrhocoris]KPA75161.1 hypothetical protein ABB37_08823 [Leptomonas pyrrhocoris]|eukprot:XP_015653600.1 hypothetical protein ABB37_08823 [Leptomonas pyrrhocoris]